MNEFKQIVADLASTNPTVRDETGRHLWCAICKGIRWDVSEGVLHKDDCPWVRATLLYREV